jgi:hypothetical protein
MYVDPAKRGVNGIIRPYQGVVDMAETRKTRVKTKAFSGAGYRNDVPLGVEIFGWGDGSSFIALMENKYMKIGWWVPFADTIPVSIEPPTQPPSDEYVLHVKDGVTRKFVPE